MAVFRLRYACVTSAVTASSRARTLNFASSRWIIAFWSCRSRFRLSKIGIEMKTLYARGAFVNEKGNLLFEEIALALSAAVNVIALQLRRAMPADARIESLVKQPARELRKPLVARPS